MKTDFSDFWPTNHTRALDHYTRELQLARATRAAEASEQIARLAVAEAHAQRKRADRLAEELEWLRDAAKVRVRGKG